MTVLVGGGAADVTDVVNRVAADFPRTALFIVVTTYLVLFVLLRSVVLPIKALVMNTLSIVASFGALVWIFQDGNLSALLGFQPLGFVETTQPVILFCVLFGLSMDYEVFLLSRMKEVWDRTGDNQEAVARGLERSGRIVTSAALIVVVVAALVRVRRHRPDQGARDRHGDRGRPRRDGRPGAARAGDDAPARATGTGGCRAACGACRVTEPVGVAPAAILALVAARSPRCAGAPILANAARRPPDDAARRDAPRRRAVRPAVAISLPRDDAPHDRLTEWWYYTGHLRDDARRPLRLRVRDLPRRARRRCRSRGRRTSRSPTRPATRSATPSGRRSGRRSTRRRPTGSTWRSPAGDPRRRDAASRGR